MRKHVLGHHYILDPVSSRAEMLKRVVVKWWMEKQQKLSDLRVLQGFCTKLATTQCQYGPIQPNWNLCPGQHQWHQKTTHPSPSINLSTPPGRQAPGCMILVSNKCRHANKQRFGHRPGGSIGTVISPHCSNSSDKTVVFQSGWANTSPN